MDDDQLQMVTLLTIFKAFIPLYIVNITDH